MSGKDLMRAVRTAQRNADTENTWANKHKTGGVAEQLEARVQQKLVVLEGLEFDSEGCTLCPTCNTTSRRKSIVAHIP